METQLRLETVDAITLDQPIAGIGVRSYAYIIDWHIRALLVAAWYIVLWGVVALTGGSTLGSLFKQMTGDSGSPILLWILVIIPSAIYFLYHPVVEIALKGRTPGKRMAGIRIVNDNGQTPRVGALLMRNAFRLVDCLPTLYVVGIVACLFSARQVRIGDMAAGTLLVYDKTNAEHANEVASIASHATLDPTTHELLQDLLARWDDLERDVRSNLAAGLLTKIGQIPPEATSGRRRDTLLRDDLKALAADRGNRG